MTQIATIAPVEDGWLVRSPAGSEVTVADLRNARYELAKLMDPDNWYEVGRTLTLIDGYGEPVQDLTMFFDWNNSEEQLAAVAAQPPEGCRWYPDGPGLHCLRGDVSNRWDAVAVLAGELRESSGATVDFGYEEDEWIHAYRQWLV